MEIVLDEKYANASGVALIRQGQVVEFRQITEGTDLGLAADEFVLTEAEEAELKIALEDFMAKMKVIYQKMDDTQAEIDKSKADAENRQKRIDEVFFKLDKLYNKLCLAD